MALAPPPPVIAPSWLPPRSVFAILARLAAWPLAWIGAKAVVSGDSSIVAIGFVAVLLVSAQVGRSTNRTLARGGLVGSLLVVFVVSFLGAMGTARGQIASSVVGALVALATALGVTFAAWRAFSATRGRTTDEGPEALDARVALLGPIATWLAVSALMTRLGAEAAHAHAWLPETAMLIALVALLVVAAQIPLLLSRGRWLERLYAGEEAPLAVRALADEREAASAPALVAGTKADAVIVVLEPAAPKAPYRVAARQLLATVPSDHQVLRRDTRRKLVGALLTFVLTSGVGAVIVGRFPSSMHAVEPAETFIGLPAECATRPAPLHQILFVPLAPLEPGAIEALARRYRTSHGLATSVSPTLRPGTPTFDPKRQQVIAEPVLAAALTAYPDQPGRVVIVVTDEDMYMKDMNWRYAFAAREGQAAIVSLARMIPAFGSSVSTVSKGNSLSCDVELRARAHKMITRQLLMLACPRAPSSNPMSVRRASILSLYDLDQIDESVD